MFFIYNNYSCFIFTKHKLKVQCKYILGLLIRLFFSVIIYICDLLRQFHPQASRGQSNIHISDAGRWLPRQQVCFCRWGRIRHRSSPHRTPADTEGGCAWFVFGGAVQTGGAFNCSSIPAKVVHFPRETLIRLPSAESADVSRLQDSHQSSQSVSEESSPPIRTRLNRNRVCLCFSLRSVVAGKFKNKNHRLGVKFRFYFYPTNFAPLIKREKQRAIKPVDAATPAGFVCNRKSNTGTKTGSRKMGATNLESAALKCVFSGSTLKSSHCFTGNRSENRWKKRHKGEKFTHGFTTQHK